MNNIGPFFQFYDLPPPVSSFNYPTRVIINRGLYTFYPRFDVQKRFFNGAFFLNFWPYCMFSIQEWFQIKIWL